MSEQDVLLFVVGFLVGAYLGGMVARHYVQRRTSQWYRQALIKSAERLAKEVNRD